MRRADRVRSWQLDIAYHEVVANGWKRISKRSLRGEARGSRSRLAACEILLWRDLVARKRRLSTPFPLTPTLSPKGEGDQLMRLTSLVRGFKSAGDVVMQSNEGNQKKAPSPFRERVGVRGSGVELSPSPQLSPAEPAGRGRPRCI